MVPDEESILSECVQAGLPRLWLSWHYRSRDESLISFSNAQYYEDRLSSFPAFPGQLHDTGVSFTRVDGTFLRSGGTRGDRQGAAADQPGRGGRGRRGGAATLAGSGSGRSAS